MTIEYQQILALIFVHWIADFVLQSHKMATNKSTDVLWLTAHVSVYTATWLAVGLFFFPYVIVLKFMLVTFTCHWITDYFTSKWTSRLWKQGRVHDFFVVVGLDQYLHYAQLIITYTFLTQ